MLSQAGRRNIRPVSLCSSGTPPNFSERETVPSSKGRESDPLAYLEANSYEGRAYLNNVARAREYARTNRLSMLRMTSELLRMLWSVDIDEQSLIESDHNHVRQEIHFGERLWVHRKGAQPAAVDEPGVIPGSMGAASYHVVGRGCVESVASSSHGAGRVQSRTEARSNVSVRSLKREMGGVFFDASKATAIRDEAPFRCVCRCRNSGIRICGKCVTPPARSDVLYPQRLGVPNSKR